MTKFNNNDHIELCLVQEFGADQVLSIHSIYIVIYSSDTIRETIEIFLFIVITTELSSRFVSLKRTSRQIDQSERATEKLVFEIENIFIAKNDVKKCRKALF